MPLRGPGEIWRATLESYEQRCERAPGRCIQRLEELRAPGSVVDAPPAEPREQPSRVQPPRPVLGAVAVEDLGRLADRLDLS